MKRNVLLILTFFSLAGCGSHFLLAKYYMYLGEQTNYKAHVLRTKKDSTEERKQLHAKACRYFVKAFQLDSRVFNFIRCEYASQSCDWSGDLDRAHFFRTLQEKFQEPEEFEPAQLFQ